MGYNVNAVISKLFVYVNYESKVRISKFKMADPIWRSQTQNSINFEVPCYDWPENYYSGIVKITEDGCKFRLWFDGSNIAAIYTFSRKNQGFWSGKFDNYYSSVWGISKNLFTNLESAFENPILRSHTWCFDRTHMNEYSFVWNIHKGFFKSFLS